MKQKVQSPDGSSARVRPQPCALPHSLSCQTQGSKRRNTSRFIPGPALPVSLDDFLLPLYLFSSRVSYHSVSICVPFCHVRRAPARHPAALPSSSLLFLYPAAHISEKKKKLSDNYFNLWERRFRSSICAEQLLLQRRRRIASR